MARDDPRPKPSPAPLLIWFGIVSLSLAALLWIVYERDQARREEADRARIERVLEKIEGLRQALELPPDAQPEVARSSEGE